MLDTTKAVGVYASGTPAPRKLKTQIVVVGGGAGGLELVRKLGAHYGREDFDIILVERNHTHIWKPLPESRFSHANKACEMFGSDMMSTLRFGPLRT